MSRHLRAFALAAVACGFLFATEVSIAGTIASASCTQNDVANAVGRAATGDTVSVPAGNCTWSGLSVAKAIHLQGAGKGKTIIAARSNSVYKQPSGVVRISGFTFTNSGGGNANKGITVYGNWEGTEPVIFENNGFQLNGAAMFRLETAGGVIIAGNEFTGLVDDSFIQPKDTQDSGKGWQRADTMGSRDTNGKLNIYVEDNTFYGGANQGIDCDENSRCVYRYNDLTYSSFNSHGRATGPHSVRHFEIYANTFSFPNPNDQSAISAMNMMVWIRGGSGVIFNNQIDDIRGWWGDKPEIRLSIRGAEDALAYTGGSCGAIRYPVAEQLGQSHNGAMSITDPIYIWGNTGAGQQVAAGWSWGNPCGFSWNDFFQWGRDAVQGTPKPGYTPYAYPHPLRLNAAPRPKPPADVSIQG